MYNDAAEFLSMQEYKHVQRWAQAIDAKARGQARPHGQPRLRRTFMPLHERHDAGDFDTRTQDKLAAE